MNTIDKKELYDHLGTFLRTKGIELKDGTYAQGIEKACGFLTDAVNIGQMGLERARHGLDRKLEQVRQVIHEKTAPKTGGAPPVAANASAPTAQKPAAKAPTRRRPATKSRAAGKRLARRKSRRT